MAEDLLRYDDVDYAAHSPCADETDLTYVSRKLYIGCASIDPANDGKLDVDSTSRDDVASGKVYWTVTT